MVTSLHQRQSNPLTRKDSGQLLAAAQQMKSLAGGFTEAQIQQMVAHAADDDSDDDDDDDDDDEDD